MPVQILLKEDVEDLGSQGDVVAVKPGYARNFLLPQGKALLATKQALKLQAALREEREKRAIQEKADAESIIKKIEGQTLTTTEKVDATGHMYGSVSAADIAHLFEAQLSIKVPKKAIHLKSAIKEVGIHNLQVTLFEGIEASVILKILPEGEQGEAILPS